MKVSMKPRSIEIDNLTVAYQKHPAIHHLNLSIPAGSLVGIAGPNGAGKSTLIKTMAGLLSPLTGCIKGLKGLRIAYLAQVQEIDRSFPITVWDMVSMGLWHQIGALKGLSADQKKQCQAALAQVGLSGFEKRPIETLSGGQFQRAIFARLILQDADLFLLDEPFVGVDVKTQKELMALIHQWHQKGKSILMVSHDHDLMCEHFSRVVLLARDLIADGYPHEALHEVYWKQAQQMHEAFDDAAADCPIR